MGGGLVAWLPAAMAAVFAGWCGSFAGGAGWAGAVVAQAVPLAVLAFGGPWSLDPLRLGRVGRWVPLVLVAAVAASLAASPVPRGGRVGALLLPAYLVVPGAVAWWWREEGRRRVGAGGVAMVVGMVAAWSLVAWGGEGTARPAEPLGHHLLLAAWIVTLLPVGVLPLLGGGRKSWVGMGFGMVAIGTVVAARSLVALAAVAVQVGLWLVVRREGRRRGVAGIAAGMVLVVGLVAGPRLVRFAHGEDASARARITYAAAAWEGFLARPVLGWGPGAAPWTAARFMEPVPGVNPPGEAVGELHSLPLQALYDLGVCGGLAAGALAGLFLARRWREARRSGSPLALGGVLGLAGAGVCALGSAAVAVTALPVAAAIAAGAALTGSGGAEPGRRSAPGGSSERVRSVAAAAGLLYVIFSAVLLLPLDLVHRHYDRALTAHRRAPAGVEAELRAELLEAVDGDPAFPLYRARLAAHREVDLASRRAAAEEARAAARAAHSVAALWTQAGVLGAGARAEWAGTALEEACETAPLDAIAPLYLAFFDPSSPLAPRRAARALAAEPRLAAATMWEHLPETFEAARSVIARWDEVDAGWRLAFADATAGMEAERHGAVAHLELGRERGAQSLSLHLFRRRPWPAPLVRIPVRAGLLPRLALPPASTLPTTAPKAFSGKGCAAPAG